MMLLFSFRDLFSRKVLDEYLSRALNIDLQNGRIDLFDKFKYVLTLDYAVKMLDIHERLQCGIPVVIEGETGVGKTALVEMLSKLWNQSLYVEWSRQKSMLLEFFQEKLIKEITSENRNNTAYQVKFK